MVDAHCSWRRVSIEKYVYILENHILQHKNQPLTHHLLLYTTYCHYRRPCRNSNYFSWVLDIIIAFILKNVFNCLLDIPALWHSITRTTSLSKEFLDAFEEFKEDCVLRLFVFCSFALLASSHVIQTLSLDSILASFSVDSSCCVCSNNIYVDLEYLFFVRLCRLDQLYHNLFYIHFKIKTWWRSQARWRLFGNSEV